ncbi:MAG: glycosyltransferase family 1 protein [Anaerolineae bacterium]
MPALPRITLDVTAAIHQTAGIGRYARDLTAALVSHPAAWRLFVMGAGLRRRSLPVPPAPAVYRPSPLSHRTHNRLWYRLRLPLPVELWTGRCDLFHALDFTLPPTLPGTRAVLTIHDLSFERWPDETMPGMLRFLQAVVPRSAHRADHVITDSEATRRDVIELYGLPPDRVTAVPLGVDPCFRPQAAAGEGERIRAKLGLPPDPFILTVGTMQPRKNHGRLVAAFARVADRARLVIAGGHGWGYDAVLAEVERLGLRDRVTFTGFVDDADLPALYRAAAAFAYPSLYEGFGLPVLEAMACGLPVLAGDVSSLPEVVGPHGEAGLLVDPLDVGAIAAGLARLLDDAPLRAHLARNAIARAGAFTWARAADLTWAVYQHVLSGG